MEYYKLTIPQHIYEQLGLHPNKTLVLKRSENVSGKNVTTSEIGGALDTPAPEIDACVENENEFSSQTIQDSTSHLTHVQPENVVVRIQFPKACENCHQKFLAWASYSGHFRRCRTVPRCEVEGRDPDISSFDPYMVPEAFHGLGYDVPVSPKTNDVPNPNTCEIDASSYPESSSDLDRIPEVLHGYETPAIPVHEIDDAVEDACGGDAPEDIEGDAPEDIEEDACERIEGDQLFLSAKVVFPRPCPICDKILKCKTTYYSHRRRCLMRERTFKHPRREISKFDYSYMTAAELRVLGYSTPPTIELEINGEENEPSPQAPSGTDTSNPGIKYPCPVCDKMCNSFSAFVIHKRQCRLKQSISAIAGGKSSLDATPGVESSLGAENKSSSGLGKRILRRRVQIHVSKKYTYPRACAKCGREYLSKESFCNHKKRCEHHVAKKKGFLKFGAGIHSVVVDGQCVFFKYDPPLTESLSLSSVRRVLCLKCNRHYNNRFSLKRHVSTCGNAKLAELQVARRVENYALPISARRSCLKGQDKLRIASDKEDKAVNWVPIATKATSAVKYFAANQSWS